jgi:hypothetical protein
MSDEQPKRGRPSDYSFQVAISICARLAEGESLCAICSDAGMLGRATVFRWIARHEEFRGRVHPRVRVSGMTKGSPLHVSRQVIRALNRLDGSFIRARLVVGMTIFPHVGGFAAE